MKDKVLYFHKVVKVKEHLRTTLNCEEGARFDILSASWILLFTTEGCNAFTNKFDTNANHLILFGDNDSITSTQVLQALNKYTHSL